MNTIYVVPALIIVFIVVFFIGNLRQSFAATESDEYEHDGNQTTRIRHEANL